MIFMIKMIKLRITKTKIDKCMKTNIVNLVIIILILPLLFSCHTKSRLEQALELAGEIGNEAIINV